MHTRNRKPLICIRPRVYREKFITSSLADTMTTDQVDQESKYRYIANHIK